MANLLEIQNIHTFIGQFHILEGVSLGVPVGSITAVLGRNGAGKTTTLKSILGLTPPRSGQVIFDGQEIQGRRSFDIAALGIGYVPEHRAIFRDLSVLENLKIAERKQELLCVFFALDDPRVNENQCQEQNQPDKTEPAHGRVCPTAP